MALDVISTPAADNEMWHLRSPAVGSIQFRPPTSKTASEAIVNDVLYRVHRVDDEARKVADDKDLTRGAKATRLTAVLAPALDAANKALVTIEQRRAERAATTAALYAPPPAEDQSQVALDIETRAAYLALKEHERRELDANMARGEADRTLQALMRAPIPRVIPPVVHETWKRRVEATHADVLAQHAAAAEDEARALGALRTIVNVLSRAPGR